MPHDSWSFGERRAALARHAVDHRVHAWQQSHSPLFNVLKKETGTYCVGLPIQK